MDPQIFDTITKRVASRRAALRAGGLGLAAVAAAPITRVAAQDSTPAATPGAYPDDPHPSADGAGVEPEFLFVQPFEGGTWEPKPGADDVYTLTLTGAAAQTIYFSDRPERITGLAPNQQFLDRLGFTPENPPNAAIVAQRGDGPGADGSDHEVLIIELFNPVYDAESETLTYDAQVLADYGEPGLANLARQQQDYELGETFGEGSLFIDDCSNGTYTCWDDAGTRVGSFKARYCWNWNSLTCDICHLKRKCAEQFPNQCLGSDGSSYVCH